MSNAKTENMEVREIKFENQELIPASQSRGEKMGTSKQ